MTWNWQLNDWPHYLYDLNGLERDQQALIKASGVFLGILKCLNSAEQDQVKMTLLSEEALNTSAIEGEILNRDSLQASLKRAFGLDVEKRHITPAEKGIAQMMLQVHCDYREPLSDEILFTWHKLLMSGRSDLETIGSYRVHAEPMLIVSSGRREPIVHFEAPPSAQIKELMENYIIWFNSAQSNALPFLVRAAIAHLYFESIHPFEDGNGRIGRALAEKALSQGLGMPSLISLSTVIESNKKAYYHALQTTNHSLDITAWIHYFSQTVIQAQEYSLAQVDFLIKKTKFFDKFDSDINERQRKVLLRMFKEGPRGFKGGLSASNYIAITGASPATATRDLHALVLMGALRKEGELRYSRYFIVC